MSAVTVYSFTPSGAGRLIVTCRYDAQRIAGTSSDWASGGTFIRGRAYITQNGVTTFGAARGITSTRASYTVTMMADVVAGLQVDCGLDGYTGGLISGQFWDIHVKVELIKR